MSGHGTNPIFFNKKNKGWTSRTLAIHTPSKSNNILFLRYLPTPPPSPQSGCHVCMTPNEKGTTLKIAQNKQKLFVICGPLEENLD